MGLDVVVYKVKVFLRHIDLVMLKRLVDLDAFEPSERLDTANNLEGGG